MHYAWGTREAIPDILGATPDGQPVAEYWLGAHGKSPSTLGGVPLDQAIADDPSLIGAASEEQFGRLPFLMKILSAAMPLSIQAHPSRSQAEEGFAREESIALDPALRSYQDTWPKPEMLVALTEFHSLNGFREPWQTMQLFRDLGAAADVEPVMGPLVHRHGEAALQEVLLDVLSLSEDRLTIIDAVLASAFQHRDDEGDLGEFARTALELDEHFPRDPGILAGLLLNRVTLQPGEATFVGAGVLHAHLSGTGIEVMASSDNVVRGGLTPKHIAVDELISIVRFAPDLPRVESGHETAPGVFEYPSDCPEFDVWRLELGGNDVAVPATGLPRIGLVTSGEATFRAGDQEFRLGRGESLFLSASDPAATASGSGQVFLSAPGVHITS